MAAPVDRSFGSPRTPGPSHPEGGGGARDLPERGGGH
jgi:hypothetical protein